MVKIPQTLILVSVLSATGTPLFAGATKWHAASGSRIAMDAEDPGFHTQATSTIPNPTTPTLDKTMGWWGDTVTYTADNLDPIPYGNTTLMFDRSVRALETSGGSPYATWAKFTIPDDARAFGAFVTAHGLTNPAGSVPFFFMVPRGIGPYTNIHGVVYDHLYGRIWVAADNLIQCVDVFLHDPEVRFTPPLNGATKPYISRATLGGSILFVDGTAGATHVYAIDVTSGAVGVYAATQDAGFTRSIQPVGIAVDPDGSACYIADKNSGKVVKIPANAGSGSTIVDGWGGRTFAFADPCGIDVHADGHEVLVANDADGYGYQLLDQTHYYRMSNIGTGVHSIEVDRDVSSPGYIFWVHDLNPGNAEAFNLNTPPGAAAPRYHGARVIGYSDGYLSVEPDWPYFVQHHWPQRVIINNAGQPAGYPSSYQTQDRVIQLDVRGCPNAPLQLRVIDPPDLLAYAPDGGWWNHSTPPSYLILPPAQPYEANDNRANGGYGVSTQGPNGPWDTITQVRPNTGYNATFHLRIPDRYSGDNFQMEVTKCRPDGTLLPGRVVGLSSVYTAWKRIFVEQDRMYRKGGVLYSDCNACQQLVVYDWHNVKKNNQIVVFDRDNPAENGGEVRKVTKIANGPVNGTKTLTLDTALTKTYLASTFVDSQGKPQPNFDNMNSAGIGVISGCTSCTFDADMGQMDLAVADACVEYVRQSSGEGALPYIGTKWFDDPINREADLPDPMQLLSETWFYNWYPPAAAVEPLPPAPHNYLHLLGASTKTGEAGRALVLGYDAAFVFRGTIEMIRDPQTRRKLTSLQVTRFCQHTTVHEFGGHQFHANACAPSSLGWHDQRRAWCSFLPPPPPPSGPNPHACPEGSESPKNCVMWPGSQNTIAQQTDGVSRFCIEDLFLLDPMAPCVTEIDQEPIPIDPEETSLRTFHDPR